MSPRQMAWSFESEVSAETTAVTPEVAAGAPLECESISSRSLAPLECFAPVPLEVVEVSALSASLLLELPAPWAMLLETLPQVHGAAGPLRFAVTSHPPDYRAARALGLPTFNASEWAAIALAAELDRVSFHTTARWLERKVAEPGLLFTPDRCIGICPGQPDRRHLSVGQVLTALGVRLVQMRVAD